MNVRNIDLREAQEKVDDNLRQAREAGRKAMLTYAGLWGMAYDEAMTVLEKGKAIFDKAEDRGEKMEADANRRTEKVRTQAEEQFKAVEARIDKVRSRFTKRAEAMEESVEADIENQVELVLERLGIPSRERISKLSAEIEALSKKIDAQLAAKDEVTIQVEGEMMIVPIAGYAEMTAKEVVALLDGLEMSDLIAIKAFEEGNQGRVTILREVDRLLEGLMTPA
ncbi:MAG: phasin family protein [Caldilineaceae bacterium]